VLPDPPHVETGLHCRRTTFERVLRASAAAHPRVTLCTGRADDVLRARGRAAGLLIDGRWVEAELVVDASGRGGRLADDLRAPGVGADCGTAYVSRQYRLLPGAERGPMNVAVGHLQTFDGYLAAVFLADDRTFSVVVARLATDRGLAALRFDEVFDAAVAAIPAPAAWTSTARARPIGEVLPGGRLRNAYRGQLNDGGVVGLPGLVRVGDAVCMTNPIAGRGVTTAMMQVSRLVALLDEHPGDVETATLLFDRWCDAAIRPWFYDHLHADAEVVRRWGGQDVDPTRRLPSDLIVAAARADPSLQDVVLPYTVMRALPATLAAAEPRAREIYAGGWRPPRPDGPTRDELVQVIAPLAAAGRR
jgi:2-polyprenyl-6-methoxyphenol hydroxylase-like FAD-dependent oxidoreductase